MKRLLNLIIYLILIILWSCGNAGSNKFGNETGMVKIKQQDDGRISLPLEKASCYHNRHDPSLNTAEWSFVVSKPGRYNVWLSSATRDTMNLGYSNAVRIDLNDERLEARPVGDKIIPDARDVKKPYFRADSYMGSVYIQEPGEYSIQVISEKVIALDENSETAGASPETMMMSVFLTPMTR